MFLVKAVPSFQSIVAFMVAYKLCKEPISKVYSAATFPKEFQSAQSMPVSSQIEIKNLIVSRGNLKFRYHPHTFKIGNNYALITASGSGKTTLMEILTGYEKNYVGNILVDGKEVGENFIAANYVFQDPFILNGSILENIVFSNKTNTDGSASKRVEELIQFLNLPFKATFNIEDYGENLSGGQKARISLARALFKSGRVIFLDECFSQIERDLAIKIISRLKKSYELIVLITHDKTLVSDDFILVENLAEVL